MGHAAETNSIYIKLFGGSIAYRSTPEEEWIRVKDSAPAGSAGKKLLSFLEYLLIHHSREVTAEELIAHFWPDQKSADPAGVLKYTLHKVRHLLQVMFPEQGQLLRTHRGHYTWRPDVKIVLDTEEFEGICTRAKWHESVEAAEELLMALELYTGDLLTHNDAEWLIPLRIYYRTLYIDACRAVLPLLQERDLWMAAITVCDRGCHLEPLEEAFTLSMMSALIAIGQPGRAMEHYEAYRIRLWNELGMVPSEQVELVHGAAVAALNTEEEDVIHLLTEAEGESSAFLCSFSVFRSIVMLEARHLAREQGNSSLLIIKVVQRQDAALPATDVRRIERVLLRTLRESDPVARLNAGSYIVMLSGASEENSHKVMARIERAFRSAYPRSKAYLDYVVHPLNAAELKMKDLQECK